MSDVALVHTFITATIAFTAIQLVLGIKCLRSPKKWSSLLGASMLAGAVVLLSYLGSAWVSQPTLASLLSSLYFSSIDVMLLAFLHYIMGTVNVLDRGSCPFHHMQQPEPEPGCSNNCTVRNRSSDDADPCKTCAVLSRTRATTAVQRLGSRILRFLHVLCALDLVVLMTNPVTGLAMDYTRCNMEPLGYWTYAPHLPYFAHLIFSYGLVAMVCGFLIYKIVTTPSTYHGRYLPTLIMILWIVVLNYAFLFLHVFYLDVSVLLYPFAFTFVYWVFFHRRDQGLQKRTQEMILNSLGHPVVFFDNEQTFCMANDDAAFLVAGVTARKTQVNGTKDPAAVSSPELSAAEAEGEFTLDDFVLANDLESPLPPCRRSKSRSFTWVRPVQEDGTVASYRCDFRVLTDQRKRIVGYLLVFIDNSVEVDTLTGFPSKAILRREIPHLEQVLRFPVSVAVFDLNRLMELNNTLGREVGDTALRLLADNMRLTFPENTTFARMDEANLLAMLPGTTARSARLLCQQITKHMNDIDLGMGPLDAQSAVATVDDPKAGLVSGITTATRSLRAQKMLDQDSAHSSLLDSLAQTLRECDGTTEAHVQRTRVLGATLGDRLGLSDFEQSSLALLCLLHDIGKLGIPLDVLNKPGKLTDEEWGLMRSHVDKGYRIAKASDELKDIAPFIRHHHECWDGNGYPDGLKHQAIPLLSRIIAVVDTYDAMVNDRPYRSAVPKREACAELMRCAGTQFDPYLVSEFVAMLEETGQLDDEPKLDPSQTSPVVFRPRGLETYDDAEQVNAPLGSLAFTEYVLDAQDRIIRVDQEFTKITGYTPDELGEGDARLAQKDLIFAEDRDHYFALVADQMSRGPEAFLEHRIRRKDGSERFVFCLGRKFFDPVNQEPRVNVIAVDLASTKALKLHVDRVRLSAQRSLTFWEQGARTDSLTGLLNSESFKGDVRLSLTDREHSLLFAILDVDHFKQYNDTFGHPGGDDLLKRLSVMLQAALPDQGFAGRLGGDEFALAVPLPLGADDEQSHAVAQGIWDVISRGISSGADGASISMGAVLTRPGSTFEETYELADKALYHSKGTGRNHLTVW
ncbi:MAG: diguanylate cyclase [Coriobacteriia bacterium]|nr:diguanylate cyclase [Coriobacteriia bacterium]